MEAPTAKIGLILSGGGARAAYQVGVLRAIAKWLPHLRQTPFPIICGTSAGAINAATLAMYADDFRTGVCRLEYHWKNLSVEDIYRADTLSLVRQIGHWLTSFLLGGLGKRNPRALLDNAPLAALLARMLDFSELERCLASGDLDALSITVSGYGSGQSVSFFQGQEHLHPWARANRVGARGNIGLEHLLASSAIPLVFPAVRINREYFCDGTIRQTAPLSPAVHLGANKVFVIGVSPPQLEPAERLSMPSYPTLAQVAGHLMNSVFLDGLEVDIERMQRINRTLALIPEPHRLHNQLALRHVDVLAIHPSVELEQIAYKHVHHFPPAMRFMLRGLGAMRRKGGVLASYLLFNKHYCRELIQLGYHDALAKREEILHFLDLGPGVEIKPSRHDVELQKPSSQLLPKQKR